MTDVLEDAPNAKELVDLEVEMNTVFVCGHELPIQEFNMAERAVWLDIRDRHELKEMDESVFRLSEIVKDFQGHESARTKALEARVNALDKRFNNLLVEAAEEPELWDDTKQDEIDKASAALDKAREALRTELEKQESESGRGTNYIIEKTREFDKLTSEMMNRKGLAQLECVWLLLQQKDDKGNKGRYYRTEKRTLEQFVADSTGTDRESAAELVDTGNATWQVRLADSPTNRATRRQGNRKK